jgi:arsenate reductase (thioredoxin)
MSKPSVLFVCVHNAGRSQMAAAFLTHLSQGAVEVRSAGSAPADQVNPAAVAALAEVGIDISTEQPKILTDTAVRESDVVITMGCGDTCPFYPGKRYEDWVLEDPAGKGVDSVRPIRDEIRSRVENLVGELLPAPPADSEDDDPMSDQRPRVLFVCVKNGGNPRWPRSDESPCRRTGCQPTLVSEASKALAPG